jgi:hypothetical protein
MIQSYIVFSRCPVFSEFVSYFIFFKLSAGHGFMTSYLAHFHVIIRLFMTSHLAHS